MTRLLYLLLAVAALPAAAEDRFRIRIDLDDDAAARLQAEGRWISIQAFYYGEALPGAPEDGGWGRARLGYEGFEVFPESQIVEFGGSLAAMPVERVEEARVSIDITTLGAPERPELLLCDFVDRTVAGFVEDGESVLECMLRED